MSTIRNFTARAGKAAVLGALTAGLTLGLATAPASAAPAASGATLTIHKVTNSSYKVYVSGVFKMSQADAQGYINNLGTGKRAQDGMGPGGIYFHLYGDDSGSYDTIVHTTGFYAGASKPGEQPGRYLYATSEGIAYAAEFFVSASVLNEDTSSFGSQEDEIYADATFVDGDNGLRRAFSNLVVRYF